MFQYSADRSSCHKSLVPGFHRAYCPGFSSCIFIFLRWLFLNSKHFLFFFRITVSVSLTQKKNLLKSGSKNMSACKVAPFVHFEHFIFLLYSSAAWRCVAMFGTFCYCIFCRDNRLVHITSTPPHPSACL